ncbi:MAG: dicarboxylate/amino acid:cation symporter [Puniceicoccaceae bacterium]|nr:MAG: dicarboxylate/amino acid:cation symporter [Puniceicoccaceae bacterium]
MTKGSLTVRILIGMALGAVVGLILNGIGIEGLIEDYLVEGLFHVLGQVFLAFLQLLVVPLVLVSLVCGTAALGDLAKLGRIGVKTVGFYLFTTAAAITLALVAALVVRPGVGFDLEMDATFEAAVAPPLSEVIIGIFPTNPFQSMAEGNMLQVIVFAVLFGIAVILAGRPGERVLAVFQDLNEIIMKLVGLVMQVAPFGVFALVARTFSMLGFEAFENLLWYFFLVLAVLIVHGSVVYSLLLRVFTGLNPITFLRNIRTAQAFAFSTASSNATIPITLNVVENKMGVHKSIGSFTVPLGATINMDGTAIMQGVATVFIAQAYGIDLGVTQLLMVILTATLASIGTAGVPGVGLIMLAMVLNQVGLPVEAIGMILGVDRLLDMVRTAVNITGDATVSCIVGKGEGQLDEEVFNTRE